MEYPSFNGSGDPWVWLRDFQMVAENNRANDRTRFLRARAAMTGAADTWFNRTTWTREDWTEFLTKFEQRFVAEQTIRSRAKNLLKTLQHAPPLKFTEHADTVLALCKDVDPSMPEEKIIAQFANTIDSSLSNLLYCTFVTTLEQLQKFVTALEKRPQPRQDATASIQTIYNGNRSRSPNRHNGTRSRSPSSAKDRPPSPLEPDHNHQSDLPINNLHRPTQDQPRTNPTSHSGPAAAKIPSIFP